MVLLSYSTLEGVMMGVFVSRFSSFLVVAGGWSGTAPSIFSSL